jgi:hypothetical protein
MSSSLLQKISTKQIVTIVILSVVAILFQHILHQVFSFIIATYDTIIGWLGKIFSNGYSGRLIEKTLALLLVPSLAALVVSAIYWAFKRSASPYTMATVWIFWLILVAITNIKGML